MLSSGTNFQSLNRLSGEHAIETLTAETFYEDVASIAKLISEGRLSQEDSEFVLGLLLSLYINDEVDVMTNQFEGVFEQMLSSLVASATE